MKSNTFAKAILPVVCLLLPVIASAQEYSLEQALTSGKAQVALRYRYEHVDQDNLLEDANASTLRIRLNYETGDWDGWSAFAEFDHIAEVFLNDFNSGAGTSPGRTQFSTVADPRGSDLNQLYLQYRPLADWQLRLGRQRILLDNHRFVGNVGWRQNPQTYDGLGLTVSSLANTELFYGYVENVNRIFGDKVAAGDHSVNTHLLHAKVKLSDTWSVTPYVYYIDNEDVVAFSTSTYGARLIGNIASGDSSINIVAEFASQSDAADNPVNYGADYANLSVLWSGTNGLELGAAYESLGGDPLSAGMAFRTPLATLHAFQGWADQFLSTPDAGVDDIYLIVKYRVASWNLQAVYHDYSAEAASDDFGTELDVSAGRKLGDRYGLLLKAALFNADSATTSFIDTDKFWVMLTAQIGAGH
ncbi:MAG: alginate export family protein [Woeseia sp.]